MKKLLVSDIGKYPVIRDHLILITAAGTAFSLGHIKT